MKESQRSNDFVRNDKSMKNDSTQIKMQFLCMRLKTRRGAMCDLNFQLLDKQF